MTGTLKRTVRETGAQDLAEYGIALAVVGAVAASAALGISAGVRALWTRILQTIIVTLLGG